MADGPLRFAYDEIVTGMNNIIKTSFENLADSVFPTITGLAIIMVAWQGYRVFYGRGAGETLANSMLILVKYGVIMAIFGAYALYELFIESLFIDTPLAIGKVLALPFVPNAGSDDIIALLDNYTRVAAEKSAAHAKGTSVVERFEAMIILAVTYLFTLFAAIQYIITEVVTRLFLILTPLALTAIMFDKTKGIFEGWLRTLTTMAILKILLIAMITLLMSIFGDAVNVLDPKNDQTGASSIGVYILITLLMMLVAFRLPEFASQMGGGLSVSATGVIVAGAAAATGTIAAAAAGSDRMQRGMRQGAAAAKDEGLTRGQTAWAAARRGVTEAVRPGLTSRRFDDQRMARRARDQVGNMKRSDGSGKVADTPKPAPTAQEKIDARVGAEVARMKKDGNRD